MRFKCVKVDLYNALQIVERAVAVRSTLPIIGNIMIEASANGLKLSSNDLELGIELLVNANVKEEGGILAPAKTLSNVISKLPEGEVSFEVINNNIKIECLKSKFNLRGLPTDEFPVLNKIKNGIQFEMEANLLKAMIKQTIIAVSLDESKHILNGVLMEVNKNEIKFVATDGFRLAHRVTILKNKPSVSENINVVIPTKALQEVSKILQQREYKGNVVVSVTKEQIAFEIDSVYLVSRLIQGQFPDYRQVIPKGGKTKIIVSRKELLDSAERASIIASANANIVKIESENEHLLITANTANVGNVAETIDIKQDGKLEGPVAFNVRLMLDVLKNIDEDNIELQLNSPTSPGVITPKEDKEYTYVIMPIRTVA